MIVLGKNFNQPLLVAFQVPTTNTTLPLHTSLTINLAEIYLLLPFSKDSHALPQNSATIFPAQLLFKIERPLIPSPPLILSLKILAHFTK